MNRKLQPIEQEARLAAQEIHIQVQAYIKKFGCGEVTCTTCKYGVAIGLADLDRAFNLGARK